MTKLFRHLWLATTLILVASAILLVSDWHRREGAKPAAPRDYPAIAVMQFSSTPLLDTHVAGIQAELQDAGLLAPDGRNLRLFNPQGDFGTANATAQEIVKGNFDIMITSSTVALQIVAKANQAVKRRHVFGAVTDPYGAGVGISGPDPEQHPAHLVGIGTFQPVESVFRLAKSMNSELTRVGVVWNPGEQCSEACLVKAHAACRELGITLVEAIATNTSEAPEAARSLLGKNIQAIWIGGDTVANASAEMIIRLAAQDNIPVFTNDPTDTAKGALLGLGADYFSVGRDTGAMAAAILSGRSPTELGVANVVPEQLSVNRKLLSEPLGRSWQLTEAMQGRLHDQAQAASSLQPQPGRTYRIALSYIVPAPVFQEAIRGFTDQLAELGFVKDKNLQLTVQHANGDMSLLPQLTQNLTRSNPDVLVAMSTPALGSAIAHGGDLPIVFGIVSAPLEAGAGTSLEDHLPNVTGVYQKLPSRETFVRVAQLFPAARRIGALHNPSEANSAKEAGQLKILLDELGMELVTLPVFQTSEVPENIQVLVGKSIDLVFVMADSTVANGLPAILKAAANRNIPVLVDDSSLMGSGGLMSCGPGPYSDGRDTAELAVRVMLGENPADLPIRPGKKNEQTLDLAAAKHAGITFPETFLLQADRFYNLGIAHGRPAAIAVVNLVNNQLLDEAEHGLELGLRDRGLRPGVDYVIKKFSAQGDLAQLPQILDAALAATPDLIVTVTTPALMAALHKVKTTPLVFTVASDPVKLDLFKQGRPVNVCGVHDDPQIDALLQMAMRHDHALEAVGTIYDPAQANSLFSVKQLRAAGKANHIKVIEATAATVSDIGMATQAVLQQGVGAIIISADNLLATGFASVHKAAQAAAVPIYVTEMNLISEGASAGIGDDYQDWGRQAGRMAATVLAGAPPAALPIEATAKKTVVQPAARPAPREAKAPAPRKLCLVMYSETQFAEECRDGLLHGLEQAGIGERNGVAIKQYNAQGDMSTLSSIMTAVQAERPDLLLTVSTPVLQAALRLAGSETNIVFTGVGDAVLAGAGSSETEHLPNVTGITTRSPFQEMARTIHATLPGVKTVGTLFTPAEINSELYCQWFAEALQSYGISLDKVPVTASSETAQASEILCRRDVQAIAQIVDNTTRPGFAQIARRAADNNLPVFVFDSAQMADGGVICIARDYYDAGLEAAAKAIRVLAGESAAAIPFSNTQSQSILLNAKLAAQYQLTIPTELLSEATPYPVPGKP